MHVAISTIAVTAGTILKIADHRECQASITRQILPQTESCRYQTLVPFLDFLQFGMLRTIAVNTRRQAFDAVDVKIKVDETCCSEIGEERLFCSGGESRKLGEREGPAPAPEIKSGTPGTNDVAEAAACGDMRRQANFAATGCLRLARSGDGRFPAEPRSSVGSFNQWIR